MLAWTVVPNEKALLMYGKDIDRFKAINHKPKFAQFPWFTANSIIKWSDINH